MFYVQPFSFPFCRMSNSPQGQSSQQSGNQQQSRGQQQRRQQGRGQQSGGTDRPHVLSGESILVETRPSWTVWVWQLLGAALLILAGLALGGESGSQVIPVVTILIALIIFASVWYQRRRIRYVVTDRRVMIVTGISAKKTTEIWVQDARSMQTGASFLERMLGHGTIILSESTLTRSSINALSFIPVLSALPIFNAGRGLTLSGIKDHTRVANIIRQRQSELKSQ